jgi:sporulation protein YlmC with PRC-barrel domain
MKSRWMSVMLSGGLVVLGATALTADQPAGRTQVGPQRTDVSVDDSKEKQAEHTVACYRASKLIGMKVHGADGKALGTIEDLVFEPQYAGIRYAALARGGFLGVGEKLIAVPWNAFELRMKDRERRAFRPEGSPPKTGAAAGELELVLNIAPSVLDKAQGFDKNHWPESADSNLTTTLPPPTKEGTPAVRPEVQETDIPEEQR